LIRKLESRQTQSNLPPQRRYLETPKKQGPYRDPFKTPPNADQKKFRRLVCLKHRPDLGQKCTDPECLRSKEHLDTTKADLLTRFQRASRAAESKKPGGGGSVKPPSN